MHRKHILSAGEGENKDWKDGQYVMTIDVDPVDRTLYWKMGSFGRKAVEEDYRHEVEHSDQTERRLVSMIQSSIRELEGDPPKIRSVSKRVEPS